MNELQDPEAADTVQTTNITAVDLPQPVRRDLVWHPGPAIGGGGTAQDEHPEAKNSWWWDGDLLLILVELQSEDLVRLVQVNADGDLLCFQDPDTEDDVGYSADDISWWAKVMDSLPTNDNALASPPLTTKNL